MFPEVQYDDQWQVLVDALYKTIAVSDTRLFPVLNRVSLSAVSNEDSLGFKDRDLLVVNSISGLV